MNVINDINIIRNEKGSTLVETAIIIMLLFIFVFGIIDFGLLLFDKQVLTNASREGARSGVVVGLSRSGCPGTDTAFESLSKGVASAYSTNNLVTFGSGNMVPSATYNDLNGNCVGDSGEDLIVTLSYNYDWLILSAFGIPQVPIDVVSIMKLE
jgi:hypothetical protein